MAAITENIKEQRKFRHNGDVAWCECPCHLSTYDPIKTCKRGCWTVIIKDAFNLKEPKSSSVKNEKMILRVIVGSQAHGLATPESDTDYRGVFVQPTQEILSLGSKMTHTSWIEGKEDDTSWEIGHFLFMATKSNPTILETFLAPRVNEDGTPWNSDKNVFYDFGSQLRDLFPYVWSSKAVRDAFIGYGLNQRKKFLENKDNRREKYAAAYLRVLFNAVELLTTGKFTVRIADTEIGGTVAKFKRGEFTIGEVIQVCHEWQQRVEQAYDGSKKQEPDIDKINEFLLEVRKFYW